MKYYKALGKIWLCIEVCFLAFCGAVAFWSAGYNWGESRFDPEVLVNEMKKRFLP